MSDWLVYFAFFLIGALLSLAILGLVVALVMPFIDRWNKRFFIILFNVLIICMTVYLVEGISYVDPSMLPGLKPVYFLESLFVSIPLPMFTVYLLHCCGENWKRSPLFRATGSLWIIFCILLIITQFTTAIYYFTPDYQFRFGPWYPLLVLPMLLVMILNLAGVIRRRNRLSRKSIYAFLLFLLPLTASLLIQMFVFNFAIADVGITVSAFSMFLMILSAQREQHMRQQQEIISQQASILVLQMRPHFIYNTMMSIYYLCKQDPEKAQNVTLDFTTYLRKNFTAIVSNDTIPFSDELEHTRAYLAVEKAGFEDRLIVEYDTPHILFRVPPLTLQPIVENAVKHGMDPDSDPLMITIRTRKTDSGSEITVEDSGIGFDSSDNNEPHIALANIRQRLEMMCSGKVITMPREGGGTVIKVIIPDAKAPV